MKVESREYKLLIEHTPFTTVNVALKQVWAEIKAAAKTAPFETNGSGERIMGHRFKQRVSDAGEGFPALSSLLGSTSAVRNKRKKSLPPVPGLGPDTLISFIS